MVHGLHREIAIVILPRKILLGSFFAPVKKAMHLALVVKAMKYLNG